MRHRFTLVVLLVVAGLSWTIRELNHQKIPIPARHTWVTSDQDTLYHLRRVDRVFRGEGLAGRDPYLSYPDGSAIPWPPYYTAIAWAWAAPGAPEDAGTRREWIERRVGSLPRLFGVATSVLTALCAVALAGPVAGLAAGTSHALSAASVVTSRVGNGDHHAFLAMLLATLLLLATRAFRADALADVRGSAWRGAAAGSIAGLAMGTWVASLVHVAIFQAALGWLVVRHARRRIEGLAAFGLSFHIAALLLLSPALFASPWRVEQPWSVVNLSWFHGLWLAFGGLVFVPLLRSRSRRFLRMYPALVAAAIAALVVVSFVVGAGPGPGIREGLAWLRRDDAFMSVVAESRGLTRFGSVAVLGGGIFLIPAAWLACAWLAFARDRFALLPWAVALPPLAAQAVRQVRFADVLAIPLAVVCAWAIVAAWRAPALAGVRGRLAPPGRQKSGVTVRSSVRGAGTAAGAACLFVLTLFAHAGMVRHTWGLRGRDVGAPGVPVPATDLAVKELAGWIREHTPTPPDYAVLAPWTWGHELEWNADRPTVATNFGTFVGEDAFRAPARFFMAEDPRAGEAILERRRARYVVVTSDLPFQVGPLIHAADLSKLRRYMDPTAREGLGLFPAWFGTVGARLLFSGQPTRPDGVGGESLDFVRLVHAVGHDSRYQARTPLAMVWERVPGAIVTAEASPGDTLTIGLVVRYPRADHELEWRRRGIAGADGVARVRVPYATDEPNGDGLADGPARWRLGGREGQVVIPESALREGSVLSLVTEAR